MFLLRAVAKNVRTSLPAAGPRVLAAREHRRLALVGCAGCISFAFASGAGAQVPVSMAQALLGTGAEGAALEQLRSTFPQVHTGELRRFLRSCNGNAMQAKKKLRRNLSWRSKTFPLEREEVLADLRRGVLVQHGSDREGRPVLIYFGDHYKPCETTVHNAVLAMVYTLEAAVQEMPEGVDQVVLFIYTPTGASIDYSLIRELSSCFSENYPERLHRAFVYPAGTWTCSFWALIRWCFVEAVRRKVVLVRADGRVAERLFDDIDPAHLPAMFGGHEDWVFSADEV